MLGFFFLAWKNIADHEKKFSSFFKLCLDKSRAVVIPEPDFQVGLRLKVLNLMVRNDQW